MKKIILLSAIFPAFVSSQESPCSYDLSVSSYYEARIQNVKQIKTTVTSHLSGLRMCHVSAKVTLSGKSHIVEGDYIFNTDMSEKDACSRALQNAKESILAEESPEYLMSNTDMSCSHQEFAARETVNTNIDRINGRMVCRKDINGTYYCR
jgi:hypothetical protein